MRLIDADALKKAMDRYWGTCQRIRKPRNGETAVFLDVRATVEKQPTIDAVPVIMCKDCKYWLPHSQFGFDEDNEEYHNYCERLVPDDDYYAFTREADDYCSKAERKEE